MITDVLTFLVCIILGFITVNTLSALIVLYNYKKKEKAKNNLVGVNTHMANKIVNHGLSNNLIKE